MKVYLDLYFLLNYILDISLLYGTGVILRRRVSNVRYFIGSSIGSLSIFLLFVSHSILLVGCKMLISSLMILTTFGRKSFFLNLFYFYILSIILGGTFYLFGVDHYQYNYFVLILGTPFILFVFIRNNIQNKRFNYHKYPVEIYYENEVFRTYGMIDTGNCLIDPYKKRGVILVNYPFKINKNKRILVPYCVLKGNGLLDCFVPDKVLINEKEYSNYLVGVSKDISLGGGDCILPNSVLEEI
ncbi:MAG: sigma-E processing peptidase SpoIIGA [Bacilli bacterium]|nr:sigma-E processing peptidase SpoIIGA [Bacilli bacterium]